MPDVKHFDPESTLDRVVLLLWRRGLSTTGIQDVLTETGLSRSSLYATFGGKDELYLAALRRYVEKNSLPAFAALAADRRGLPAIRDFLHQLIDVRCRGPYARWGCMVVNTCSGPHLDDPRMRAVLATNRDTLRKTFRDQLAFAGEAGQLHRAVDADAAAELLAVTTYGLNVTSRTGADPGSLTASVDTLLDSLRQKEIS